MLTFLLFLIFSFILCSQKQIVHISGRHVFSVSPSKKRSSLNPADRARTNQSRVYSDVIYSFTVAGETDKKHGRGEDERFTLRQECRRTIPGSEMKKKDGERTKTKRTDKYWWQWRGLMIILGRGHVKNIMIPYWIDSMLFNCSDVYSEREKKQTNYQSSCWHFLNFHFQAQKVGDAVFKLWL